ncbi:MAG: sulfatase-like hydrolase/transferase [Rikenellaceae bacterium]
MNKTFYYLTASAIALSGCNSGASNGSIATSNGDMPNLLVIHTDEHSFRTLSCYQELLPQSEAFVWGKDCNSTTPNIDRLAKEGAICMRYYCSTPVSTPSRSCFVTGHYPNETGAWHNELALRKDMPTFGTILRDNGYATSYVGKWHMSGGEGKYTFNVAYNGGFTDNKYMMNSGHAPFFQLDKDGEVITALNKNQVTKAIKDEYELVHMTDFFTDKTIDIINRDSKKPFAIMLSIPDPHTPDYALPEYYDKYKDIEPTMPISGSAANRAARPLWADTGKNDTDSLNVEGLKNYFGMVSHIDDSVGRLLKALDDNGVLDNTIIVFTADHGEMYGEHGRMNKGNPYEGSTRIPFVIRYPKAIKAGKVLTKSYSNVNFTPTILAMMGVDGSTTFTGVDDSSDFTSNNIKDQSRMVYLSGEENDWAAAVDDRYKLVLSLIDEPWLFDLIEDPNELTNLYNDPKYEDIARQMQKSLEERLCTSLLLRNGTKGLKAGKYSSLIF